MNADKHMAENFRTISQLIRYLTDEMIKTHRVPYDVVNDNYLLIPKCTHLFRLSNVDAEKLMDGVYSGCMDAKQVKEDLLFDYCVLKLEEFQKSRSINSYKNYLMQE